MDSPRQSYFVLDNKGEPEHCIGEMFAKVFTQIFDSSIAENYEVRHVFEDMLKLADREGAVDMTGEAEEGQERWKAVAGGAELR